MPTPAITVENLSKVYRLGVKDETPDTIAGAFAGALRSPLRNWRRLRDLARFKPDDDSPDALWALRDVSFEVQEGEVLGVIGRNGAGKSTLLKILSRITEPTHGRAVIHGRVSSLLEVGTGFHPELTGRENVYMNGTILGMRKLEIDRKFDEIVEFSGVEKFLDTPIKRYSSGMNVRLAFAVAAHLEPEILIVDEVLAVGDMEFQKKCLGKMKDVARGGRTVLFVSHNMAAISSLCTVGMLIAGGRNAVLGATGDVITQYLSVGEQKALSEVEIEDQVINRRGSHKCLRRVRFRGERGNALSEAEAGDFLEIDVDVHSPVRIRAPWIHIAVMDEFGSKLFTVGTNLSGVQVADIDGAASIRCMISNLPLSAGTYTLTIGIGSLYQNELIDAVEHAVTLHVQRPTSSFGADHVRKHGPVLVPSSWTVEDANGVSAGGGDWSISDRRSWHA